MYARRDGLGQYRAETPDYRLFAGIDNVNAGQPVDKQHTQEQTQKRLPGIDMAESPRHVLPRGIVPAEKTFKPRSKGGEKSGNRVFNPGEQLHLIVSLEVIMPRKYGKFMGILKNPFKNNRFLSDCS
jgi:hypothetical protein